MNGGSITLRVSSLQWLKHIDSVTLKVKVPKISSLLGKNIPKNARPTLFAPEKLRMIGIFLVRKFSFVFLLTFQNWYREVREFSLREKPILDTRNACDKINKSEMRIFRIIKSLFEVA